ncbi:hypothetical protein NDU88_003288 [Pleurodeles waltl]|uniref:Uncharacterized protein n=1 Tax=Pleurodeles waltl TaxID=8319 RepID=A0AAV7M3K3_PLEWA|nr:hypothetical protein NDU88_003288 [Pleurodeles waltl]
MATSDLGEELKCSICLGLYQDPVSLRCGHNFCRSCIRKMWDGQTEAGVFACPYCREVYLKRPKLKSNWTLNNVVKCYISSRAKMEKSSVFCTYCLGPPTQADKLCLQCEMFLCESHLQKHNERANHFLAEPTTLLESRKCSTHKELFKCYCADDDTYLCVTCVVINKHKDHRVQLLSEASEKWKEELEQALQKLTMQSKTIGHKVDGLLEYKANFSEMMTCVKTNTSALFSDMRALLDDKEKEFQSKMKALETNTFLQISHHIQEQENKRSVIVEKMQHLKELCSHTDPLTLLEECKLLYVDENDPDESEEESDECGTSTASEQENEMPNKDRGERTILVTLQSVLNSFIEMIPKLKTKRGIYLRGSSDIILDVGTIGLKTGMVVSEDLKTVSHSRTPALSLKSDVFKECFQVLGSIAFSSGQHYWEVETSSTGIWAIGVAYPSIERVGPRSGIGYNDKSWCLDWNMEGLTAYHNSKADDLEFEIFPNKFGIYLDYDSGVLSFYHVSESVSHLYSFTAAFTEPLQPAFCVDDGGWVRIRSLQC